MSHNSKLREVFSRVYSRELSASDAEQILAHSLDDTRRSAGELQFLQRRWVPTERRIGPARISGDWLVLIDEAHSLAREHLARLRRLSAQPEKIVALSPERLTEFSSEARLRVVCLWPLAESRSEGLASVLRRLGQVNCAGVDLYYVFPLVGGFEDAFNLAIESLLRTARLELPSFRYRLIGVDTSASSEIIARELAPIESDQALVFTGDECRRPEVIEVAPPQREQTALDAGGCWLISGGLGGLGVILARQLVRRGVRKLML